jgi:hypothetical protein
MKKNYNQPETNIACVALASMLLSGSAPDSGNEPVNNMQFHGKEGPQW